MTPIQLIFIATALMTLLSAVFVVNRKNMVHAGLFMVLSFFGIAIFFVLLSATYLAVVQVIVYIGAIAILVIFAVMFTRRIASDDVVTTNENSGMAGIVSAMLFFTLLMIMGGWSKFNMAMPVLNRPGIHPDNLGQVLIVELGVGLLSPDGYVIPFEVASILLLVALIGAVIITWKRSS